MGVEAFPALWEPERHMPLAQTRWDQGAAHAAIERIAADTRNAFSPEALWPLHPLDGGPPSEPLRCLYFGAAGVVWALDYLTKEGACSAGETFAWILPSLLEPNRRAMEQLGVRASGLLMGDSGVLLTRWRTERAPDAADALAGAIAATVHHPALEIMWGSPGAMLAALAMHDWTGEARWAELVRACASALEEALMNDDECGCRLWTQDLYGFKVKHLGFGHGFAGNAHALISARRLLPPEQWQRLSEAIANALAATARWSGQLVNWPQSAGPPRAGRTALLMQHCHGAPGICTSLAGLDQPVDALLIAAGETTWQAGPLAKGASLCHGAAGNGYAFLSLFERTGDQLWLERARSFAMHAIGASNADFDAFGLRRYSLWTGDLGLACFLLDCIEAKARFPTMQTF